jgi:hypothetical protein
MPLKSPEQVVRGRLLADATVAAAVATRVYPVIAPSSAALPFVTYRRTGITRGMTLAGPQGTPNVFVDFAVFATTYEAVREVADAMRKSLDGWSGNAYGVTIGLVSLTAELDDYVQLQGSEVPPVYQVTQTYDILWSEAQ